MLGHEIAGVVESIGKDVPRAECHLKEGDRVMVFPWRGCRKCEACIAGYNNLCEDNEGSTTEVGQGDNSGGYSTHVPVQEWELLVKIPQGIPMEVACMLPCSALTAYCSILKAKAALDAAVRVRGVANFLIIGTGGLGIWTVLLVKSVFCEKNVKVVCADISKEKLKIAADMGADDVIEWPPDASKEDLISATTVSGYNKIDAAVDFVGKPKTTEVAFGCLHRGGTVIVIGLRGGQISLPLPVLTSMSASIQGVRVGGMDEFRDLVQLISVQQLDKHPPLEFCRLEDINKIHEKLRKGELMGRAIINFTEIDVNQNQQ